jgi:SAM-dependent methyltransferase
MTMIEREIGSNNLATMRSRGAVTDYALAAYIDPGEKILYDSIAEQAAGKPVLDIGVGVGRTVPHLTAISGDYTAVDYSPEMVAAFERRFPKLRIAHANAADLGAFKDASIYLAVFSCCGIDMVGRSGRQRILGEVRRILAPDGAFVFSTHNLDGRLKEPSFRDLVVPIPSTLNPLKLGWGVARSVRRTCLRTWNYRKLRRFAERRADWAILTAEYHDFGVLQHYITVGAQRRELEEAGFAPDPLAYTNEGAPIRGEASTTRIVHWMARAPELGRPSGSGGCA